MRFLRTLSDGISKVENGLLIFLVVWMIVLSFYQFVLRTFFYSGILWADAMLRNMVLWVGFVGASLATQNHRHLAMDALTQFFSSKWRRFADLVTSSASFLVTLVFVYASILFVLSEYHGQATTFLAIPFWIVQLIMPVGFSMISVRFLIRVLEAWEMWRRADD